MAEVRHKRRQAVERLKKSEAGFRALVSSIPAITYTTGLSEESPTLWVSSQVEDLLGYTPEEFANDPGLWVELLHSEDRSRVVAAMTRTHETGEPLSLEYRMIHRDGSEVWFLGKAALVRDETGEPLFVQGVMLDIHERKKAERMAARKTRALRALSSSNFALIGADDEVELAREICRVVVEKGGYRLAWVGFAEHDRKKTVRPVAQAGFEEGYLDTLNISWANVKRGRGPTGTAIRTGDPVVARNILTDPNFEPWRCEASKRGYRSSISVPLADGKDVIGAINIYSDVADAFDAEEIDLVKELAADLGFGIGTVRTRRRRENAEIALRKAGEQLQRTLLGTVEALAHALEIRDPYTAGHQSRVADLAVAIAEELDIADEDIEGIRLAALIHDIGKIYVPVEILVKPGKLTDFEFAMIKAHARCGYDIVKNLEFPWPIADMIGQHHERMDGSGYPDQIFGSSICLGARIIAVADTMESMASNRPYRPAVGLAGGLLEILGGKCTLYDADVVDACITVIREKRFSFS